MGRANEEAPPGSRSGASHRLRSRDAPASPRINPAPRDRFGHMRAKGSAGVSALYGGGGPRGGRASLCLDPHGPLRLSNDRGSARRPQMYLRNGHRVVLCDVDNRPAKPLPQLCSAPDTRPVSNDRAGVARHDWPPRFAGDRRITFPKGRTTRSRDLNRLRPVQAIIPSRETAHLGFRVRIQSRST